ncbi:MAG: DUF4333 domain-containing protein [Acidimicrobiales bacterium]
MRSGYPAPRPARYLVPACAGLLAAASLALPGCSIKARDTISAQGVESSISSQLAKNYHVHRSPVHCPPRVPAKVGTTFTCRATLDGQVLRVHGRVTDGNGQVELKPASAVVVTSSAVTKIAHGLEGKFNEPVSVACPVPALVVAPVGHVFRCVAHVGTVVRQVVVTVADMAGRLRYRVLPYRRVPGRAQA